HKTRPPCGRCGSQSSPKSTGVAAGEETTSMAPREDIPAADRRPSGSSLEVLGVFFRLGLTSFGGPVAHLGYFREEFVRRRGWLHDKSYAGPVPPRPVFPRPPSSPVGLSPRPPPGR